MLTLPIMGKRSILAVIFIAVLSGCATTNPELKPPSEGIVRAPEAPFRNQPKIEVSADALAYSHFLKAHMLLGEGDFDGALKEFEAAAQAVPTDAFLRFRLATLYLRKGDLKRAVEEAEAATKLD